MKEQDCPQPLRRYFDVATGKLRFRGTGMTFSRWIGLLVFGAGAVAMLVCAIAEPEGRWRGIAGFLVMGAMIAVNLTTAFCNWTELDHADGEWMIQPGFWRRKGRLVRVRDADVMTVFVCTTSSWPDFDQMTSLKIEFPALPFAGPPPPVEILQQCRVARLDLAHLGQMFEDFAQAVKAK